VVYRLLGAVALVAWSKSTAGSLGEQASLNTGGLRVVVDIVDNDAPFTFNILSTFGGGIGDVRGADVAFWTSPVGDIIRRITSGGTSVVGVVKGLLLVLGDHVYEIISGLIGNISVLLGEKVVSADGSFDLVSWVLIILKTVAQGGVSITSRGSSRVTVFVFILGSRVTVCWGWVVGWGWAVGGPWLVAVGWGMVGC